MEGINKKPAGFYICSISLAMDRFAYYSAKWLIAVFVVASVASGGLGLTAADGAKMSANLVAFTYLAPLFGSYLSDNLVGARYLVPIGYVIAAIGFLFGWQAKSATGINIMIALVAIGTGLYKTQNQGITGRLFDDKDQLDSAYTAQYSIHNIGTMVGTLIIGVLAGITGYRFCFVICSAVTLFNAIFYVWGWRYLGNVGKKPFKYEINDIPGEEEAKETDGSENRSLTGGEKKRILAIILLAAFSIIFWLFWYVAFMPVYYHWGGEGGAAAWNILGFQVPTSWFDASLSLWCILLGPILSNLWNKKSKTPEGDWSIFQKVSVGMLFLGLGWALFAFAEISRGNSQVTLLPIVVFGLLISIGEMLFSPLGNSFISKYSPGKYLTVMLAVWNIAIFIASKSYGYLYEFTLNFDFGLVCIVMAAIVIISAFIIWALNDKLIQLVEPKGIDKTKVK